MTPSRLGSRGRPPRLGRATSVVERTAIGLTLDTKDRDVPELRLPVNLWVTRTCGRTAAARLSAAGTRSVILRTWEPSAAGSVAAARTGRSRAAPTRALLATSIGHVLPTVARIAKALG